MSNNPHFFINFGTSNDTKFYEKTYTPKNPSFFGPRSEKLLKWGAPVAQEGP